MRTDRSVACSASSCLICAQAGLAIDDDCDYASLHGAPPRGVQEFCHRVRTSPLAGVVVTRMDWSSAGWR
jgi:hypothetical protein